jgi:hypothetical protein
MNCGIGALGPYNHANATIGRAYSLLSQNLQGGSEPGLTYLGSQGNNYAYNSICFAENEERSPWEPFHVSKGFKPTDSTVSAFGGCRHTAFTLGVREAHWRDHVRNMLRGMDPREHPLFVLDPITAELFIKRGGFDTKDKLIDWAYDNACMAAGEYWDYQLIQNYIYPRATYGEEPYASMLATPADELVHMFKRDEIEVVVVGGETNGYWRIFGANYGARSRFAVTANGERPPELAPDSPRRSRCPGRWPVYAGAGREARLARGCHRVERALSDHAQLIGDDALD